MSSVEKRLDLLSKEEEKPQEVSESERKELLALTDKLLSSKISLELCYEVASKIKTVLEKSKSPFPVVKNLGVPLDHSPPFINELI